MPEPLACRWLRKALDDLRLAEAAMDIGVDPGLAAFHAQQAAEKALKALLVAYGVPAPRTHDLWELIDLLGKKTDTSYLRGIDAEELTYYAVEPRYPGPPIIREEAEYALDKASKVVDWVKQQLSRLGVNC